MNLEPYISLYSLLTLFLSFILVLYLLKMKAPSDI